MEFNLTKTKRQEILKIITSELESVYNDPSKLIVSTELDIENIHEMTNAFNFDQSNDVKDVMLHVISGLKKHAVHPTHPSYYGLFNPRPNFPSIMADVISGYLNPQLAGWGHAPYACEIERLVIKEFGKQFGYQKKSIDGTFCTGGAESNLTAVLCALNKYFPSIAEDGLIGLDKKPTIYCSSESHHSIEKAAKIVGLGSSSVISIAVNSDLRMDIDSLKKQIHQDKSNGCRPFMIVGTAGTTGIGVIDDLSQIADFCKQQNIWFHVDAAWGGGAIVTEYKNLFKGIEKSDSITLDLHKWFSVPMATSLFLTSNISILNQTFKIRTDYMPSDGDQIETIDPYIHSIQWSRRFIGLKIYLPLAIFGWEGYKKTILHQIEMGNVLRSLLRKNGWIIKNETKLPVICFTHPNLVGTNEKTHKLVTDLQASGQTWISTYPIGDVLTLRACITNYATQVEDLQNFVKLLETHMSK